MTSHREVIPVILRVRFSKELHEFPPVKPARKQLVSSLDDVQKNTLMIALSSDEDLTKFDYDLPVCCGVFKT